MRPGVLSDSGSAGAGGIWALKSKMSKLQAEASAVRARRDEEVREQLDTAIAHCRELQAQEKKTRARTIKTERALASNGVLLDAL